MNLEMAKKLVISVLIVLVANFLWASASPVKDTVSTYTAEEKADQKKSKIKEDIKHHLQDSHDFHLFTDETTGKHYGFPLPVILWDEELHVFMSSEFHHGESIVQSKDKYYELHHGKIHRTDESGNIIESAHPIDFSITKNVFMIMVISLMLFIMLFRTNKSYKKRGHLPSGIGRFIEPIILYVRDDIAIPNIGKKHYRKYMGFLLTVFFFVWLVNLFGLTPIGVNITNNIAVTFCLALLTYLITIFTAKKTYWLHLIDPLGNTMPWIAKIPLYILLVPIELLGTIIKPFSLMIRLYANITAGHIVLMSLIGMMFVFNNWIGSSLSFLLAFTLGILELLVAALQAYIFTMLSAVYFGSAVAEHEHDEEH
tara:strand:- start:553 stop:1659 length:1107 start_codon:yes stop_codon:yes gene_type:complete